MLTAVTLSANPAPRPEMLPRNVAYVNHVEVFETAAGLYKARIAALRKVPTEYWFFQDYDDPLPNTYLTPRQGLIHGTFVAEIAETGQRVEQPRGAWDALDHKDDPFAYIRRAMCQTAPTQRILDLLPAEGEYFLDSLLYYFLAKHYGTQYDPALWMVWRKRPTGMHRRCIPAVRNSSQWLLENESSVLDSLK